MKNSVLAITINGKQYPQGKYFEKENKKYFVVNIDEKKLFKTFNGYAISKEILETFSTYKLRNISIVYRFIKRKTTYYATPSLFKSKGILVSYGGHSQYVLPINNWKVYNEDFLLDPKQLPIVNVLNWKPEIKYKFENNKYIVL